MCGDTQQKPQGSYFTCSAKLNNQIGILQVSDMTKLSAPKVTEECPRVQSNSTSPNESELNFDNNSSEAEIKLPDISDSELAEALDLVWSPGMRRIHSYF